MIAAHSMSGALDDLDYRVNAVQSGASCAMINRTKESRESVRWLIMLTLYNACPIGASEMLLLVIIQTVYLDASTLDIRRELDYLADNNLVELRKEPFGYWFAGVTRYGTDVVEYNGDCIHDVARPVKYWNVNNAMKSGAV